jgi:hypothetical protein
MPSILICRLQAHVQFFCIRKICLPIIRAPNAILAIEGFRTGLQQRENFCPSISTLFWLWIPVVVPACENGGGLPKESKIPVVSRMDCSPPISLTLFHSQNSQIRLRTSIHLTIHAYQQKSLSLILQAAKPTRTISQPPSPKAVRSCEMRRHRRGKKGKIDSTPD